MYRNIRQASLINVISTSRYITNRFGLGTLEVALLDYLHAKVQLNFIQYKHFIFYFQKI